MNKKGFTMTELMFSIVIISIVMAFLIKLLIDINYDKTNELYATANNVNRAEIIKTIESDFAGGQLNKVNITNEGVTLYNQSNKQASIKLQFGNENYISYKTTNEKDYKWKVKSNNSETHIYKNEIVYKCIKDSTSKNYLITINIPIIVDNSKEPEVVNGVTEYKDSKMDDITLTFHTTSFVGGGNCNYE